MEVIDWQDCNYTAAEAATYMEDMLQKYGEGEIQAIYAHNDQMALAAAETLAAAGRDKEGILICGMDGEEAAFKMVEDGSMAFTIIYPQWHQKESLLHIYFDRRRTGSRSCL